MEGGRAGSYTYGERMDKALRNKLDVIAVSQTQEGAKMIDIRPAAALYLELRGVDPQGMMNNVSRATEIAT